MKQLSLLLLIGSIVALTTKEASAVVYCVFGVYQPGCVARPNPTPPRALGWHPRPVVVAPRPAGASSLAPLPRLLHPNKWFSGWNTRLQKAMHVRRGLWREHIPAPLALLTKGTALPAREGDLRSAFPPVGIFKRWRPISAMFAGENFKAVTTADNSDVTEWSIAPKGNGQRRTFCLG